MSEVVLEAQVRKHLQILGLPCLAKALDDILAWARKERPGALSLIERATAPDAEHVLTRSIEGRLKGSGLPDRPTLETFDFDFQPAIDKALVMQLAELDFIRAHEDVVLTGTAGTGKSHIVKAHRRPRVRRWNQGPLPPFPRADGRPVRGPRR